MKVEIKTLPKSELQLTITVPYKTYEKWQKKAMEEIGKNIKVSGFRAGHIPEDVIRKKVSPEEIKAATLDHLLPQTYSEAIQKDKVPVIAQPNVEIKSDVEKEGDDFVYVAKVAVMPEVKMGDYKKIKVKREKSEVKKESIKETIKMIMERYAEWQDVDRAAKKDDRAEIEFAGFNNEGKAIPNTDSKNHPIILGSKTMIPGFEDAIIGMKKGESKEEDIKFPENYHAKEMQGKKVKFKITLNRLEEKKEQKLDESMVEKITGKKQSIKEFEKLVEADLQVEMDRRGQEEHDNKVVTEVMKITKTEIPAILIDEELGYMMDEQKKHIAQQGLKWEDYLKHINKTEEDFKNENRKMAEERIKARLGVQHIIQDAKISADDKEVKARIEEMIAKYPKEQQKNVKDHYKDEKNYTFLKNNMAADKLIAMLTK